MADFFKMWWMLWWRLSLIAYYFGYDGTGPALLIGGVVAAIIAFEAKRTIVIFPIIRQFYGDGAIEYRRGFPKDATARNAG